MAAPQNPAYGESMKTSRILVACSALLALIPAGVAWAQESAALPPAPVPVEKPPLALYIVIVLILAFGSVMLSIMPSKRGHQD